MTVESLTAESVEIVSRYGVVLTAECAESAEISNDSAFSVFSAKRFAFYQAITIGRKR